MGDELLIERLNRCDCGGIPQFWMGNRLFRPEKEKAIQPLRLACSVCGSSTVTGDLKFVIEEWDSGRHKRYSDGM